MINKGKIMQTCLIFFCLLWLVPRFAGLGAFIAQAADRYVRPPETCTNTDLQSPYTSWDIAATNIEWAVNVATNNDTVWVTNGNYSLTNTIIITASNITLQSVNGRDLTFINGGSPKGSLVSNRCMYISGTGIVVDGFTITNGCGSPTSEYGKGAGIFVLKTKNARVQNCAVKFNYSPTRAGGICGQGLITNCIIESNKCEWGAGGIGTSDGNSSDSLIIANCLVARNNGVGIDVMFTASGNSCIIRNCVVRHNYVTYDSDAQYGASGAGVRCAKNTTVENCTIVSNFFMASTTNYFGGGIGVYAGATNVIVRNSIIYSNAARSNMPSFWPDWCTNNSTGTVFYSCSTSTTNGMEGSGNITNWPMFVDWGATNYKLAVNSPCVNTGTNQSWMTNAVDLEGMRRIRYGTVDMGAYERMYNATFYGFR